MASEKFKALVHFMVHECQNNPNMLGAIRLNKAIWYVDVAAYKMNRVSLTGESYVKRKNGPVPAHILATLDVLSAEGKIHIQEPEHKYDARKFISLVVPESGHLSDDEKDLARAFLKAVLGFTANGISELTHDIIWNAAAEGEEIPMCATLASQKGEISSNAKTWASEIVAHIGEKAA